MQQQVLRAGRPVGIKLECHLYAPQAGASPAVKENLQKAAEASFQRVWAPFEEAFREAEEQNDENETHRIWSLVSEMWLYLSQVNEKDPHHDQSIDFFIGRIRRVGGNQCR